MEILIINGHDYTNFIKRRGYQWKRTDIDSPSAARTLDAKMHRGRLGTKRVLSYTLMEMPRNVAAMLDEDLGTSETFDVTYFDLHGSNTAKFYCESFQCILDSYYEADSAEGYWADATFTLIEV